MVDHWHLYVNGELEYSGTADELDAYLLLRNVKQGDRVSIRSGLEVVA